MADDGRAEADDEHIPLVLPLTGPGEESHSETGAPSSLHALCKAITLSGKNCGRIAPDGDAFCGLHSPNRKPADYKKELKTAKDVLNLLSDRLEACSATWPAGADPLAEKVICELTKTYALVHQCTNDAEAVGISAFRLKRRSG